MRIAELRARECYDDIFLATLGRHLSIWHSASYDVTTSGRGQRWREHRIFSAYLADDATRAVRRFLADQVRYTSNPIRRVPQFLIGTAAATSLGVRLASTSSIFVSPDVPHAKHLTVLPGNRRLRFFDLKQRVSRVVLKEGFSADAIETEIRVRGGASQGPFPPITDADIEKGWFTEPLYDGRVLARISDRVRANAYREQALRQLNVWAAHTREDWPLSVWWSQNAVARAHLGALLPQIDAIISEEDVVPVQSSHGDFQPGNILVQPKAHRVWLLDWEFFGVRSRHYDAIVLLAGLRWPAAAMSQVADVLAGHVRVPSMVGYSHRARRRALLIALVEDISLRLRGHDDALHGDSPPEIPPLLNLLQLVLRGAV